MRHAEPYGIVVWLLATATLAAMFGLPFLLRRRTPRKPAAPAPSPLPEPRSRDTQPHDAGPAVKFGPPQDPE